MSFNRKEKERGNERGLTVLFSLSAMGDRIIEHWKTGFGKEKRKALQERERERVVEEEKRTKSVMIRKKEKKNMRSGR